ncbi:MAG: anaerobic ribonucleoside-triphosphate reductase activating protein, partial [Erysipelotrichaceae bacterium]|nr:anaerobic ribonucleoside-triphosphate reductase activating protein [Erysipelotrichaceae bacterium]
FLLNISVLYRLTQKYFDRHLASYGLGAGQMIFLLLINEQDGITMQQLTLLGDFDKGTTTKSIQKLEEEGYIEIRTDDDDKRVRRLYTTKKTGEVINELYQIRNDLSGQLTQGINPDTVEQHMTVLQKMTANARSLDPEETYQQVKLAGIQKLTLLDYPGQVACTIFTAGCNMKCPFCHNRDLVFIPENFEFINPEEIINFLKKRQGILDAVCITGGEPTLQTGLKDFIREIRNIGYKVKLDTNGMYPEKLQEIVESGLIDYVAMDIKNSRAKYPLTTGLPEENFPIDKVERSVKYLLEGNIDYEFRTTVVRELHTVEDLLEIAGWIKGTNHYYLQQFVDSGRCIEPGYTAYDGDEMKQMCAEVQKILPCTELRGIS